jgi:hypothetical protein
VEIQPNELSIRLNMSARIEKIRAKAIALLKLAPSGIRYSELKKAIYNEFPEFSLKSIGGCIWNLDVYLPKEVYKPERGLFRHISFREEEPSIVEEIVPVEKHKIKEEDFYKPFSDWLVNEIEDCTKAIPLGGNKFRDKWGTPDVIGIRESSRSDIVKSPTEIISAEIKLDTRDLITAFGQACSYKLFSHKTYIVIPKNSSLDDISKLDSLCLIFGIGLVLFTTENHQETQFEIRVRPTKHEPDMFFVNKNMKLIEKELFG